MSARIHRSFTTSPQRQRGFNMIEVLVAVVILAIGLLSIAALQIQGVRQNFDSYLRSQAVMIANDYAERLAANRPGVVALDYGAFDASSDIDCASPPDEICATQSDTATPDECTSAQMATYDQFVVSCGYPMSGGIDDHDGGAKNLLLNGNIAVACLDTADAVATCALGLRQRITVSWDERAADSGTVTRAQVQLVVQP